MSTRERLASRRLAKRSYKYSAATRQAAPAGSQLLEGSNRLRRPLAVATG